MRVAKRGNGATRQGGIRFIITGDADDFYDFTALDGFVRVGGFGCRNSGGERRQPGVLAILWVFPADADVRG